MHRDSLLRSSLCQQHRRICADCLQDVMLAMGLLPGVPGDVCMEMAGGWRAVWKASSGG